MNMGTAVTLYLSHLGAYIFDKGQNIFKSGLYLINDT